jgi:hypothetical protein
MKTSQLFNGQWMSESMAQTPKKIETIEQLKEESKNAGEFFIVLNFGLRSSKRIWWNGTHFFIYNYIDNTEEKLTPEKLAEQTNIKKAMDKGAFYKEADD